MRITRRQLRRVIREQLLKEGSWDDLSSRWNDLEMQKKTKFPTHGGSPKGLAKMLGANIEDRFVPVPGRDEEGQRVMVGGLHAGWVIEIPSTEREVERSMPPRYTHVTYDGTDLGYDFKTKWESVDRLVAEAISTGSRDHNRI